MHILFGGGSDIGATGVDRNLHDPLRHRRAAEDRGRLGIHEEHAAARVMDLLLAQTREHDASLVLVTHSDAAAARADRVLRLTADGIAN